MEIYQWPSLILTHTGIQYPNGPWFSGMEISSSRGLKKFPFLKTGPFGNPIFPIDAQLDQKIVDGLYYRVQLSFRVDYFLKQY